MNAGVRAAGTLRRCGCGNGVMISAGGTHCVEESHGQESEEESNVDSGQGLDPQCPEDAHVEAAGSCAQEEETAEGGGGCGRCIDGSWKESRRLTELQRGYEPGTREGVEGRLVHDVEDDIEGIPGLGRNINHRQDQQMVNQGCGEMVNAQ